MLNEAQREQNYAYQKVANGGFNKTSSVPETWEPTPAQARRLRKKANKAKGDAPRSRKFRYLDKLRKAIEDKRKSLTEAQVEVLDKVVESAPAGKSLCPKEECEPFAPDYACRTKSGKKTKDHAGRVR